MITSTNGHFHSSIVSNVRPSPDKEIAIGSFIGVKGEAEQLDRSPIHNENRSRSDIVPVN